MGNKTLLTAEHIDKRFGITHAVNDVSLTIDAGEIRGLIGENGSGKSTFSQMLCGIYSIGGGTFTLDGQQIHPRNQVEANNVGIAIIVQEMGTLSGLTVAENIFLCHTVPLISPRCPLHRGQSVKRSPEARRLSPHPGWWSGHRGR